MQQQSEKPPTPPVGDASTADNAAAMDIRVAQATLDDLIARASAARDMADEASAEDPGMRDDAQMARNAILLAQRARDDVQLAVQNGQGHRAKVSADVNRLVQRVSGVVNEVVQTIRDHEQLAGHESSAVKQAVKAAVIKKEAAAESALQKIIKDPIGAARDVLKPGVGAVIVTGRKRSVSADADEDNAAPKENPKLSPYVGSGSERRLRKATGEIEREVTHVMGKVLGDKKADEVVSTVSTGFRHASVNIGAVIDGDKKAAEASALAFGRGVRNVLRDDWGLDAQFAQDVGHMTNKTIRKSSELAIDANKALEDTSARVQGTIRKAASDAVDGAKNAAANSADHARDYAASWTKLGKQLEINLPQFAGSKDRYDTDKDGKVELYEVVQLLKDRGVKEIRDINGDGKISLLDVELMLGIRASAGTQARAGGKSLSFSGPIG